MSSNLPVYKRTCSKNLLTLLDRDWNSFEIQNAKLGSQIVSNVVTSHSWHQLPIWLRASLSSIIIRCGPLLPPARPGHWQPVPLLAGPAAAAAVLPWCWLSAAYSAPQNSADQKSLHHHYQIPRAGAKCGKLFFCRCLCLSVQCASPLFQQSFFSFLIFFRLHIPKFLSSYIIHLEEAIHFKIFLLCTNLFRSPDKKD